MAKELMFRINKRTGEILTIYDDESVEFCNAAGTATMTRASHVEPEGNQWVADMSPVGGPKLPAAPLRSLALQAEVGWLEAKFFCPRQPAAENAGKEDR